MTASAYWYAAYGLRIRSFRELPLPPSEADSVNVTDVPDIDVLPGSPDDLSDAPLDRDDSSIVASYEAPQGRWYVGVADTDGYRLTFRDCGEFVITADTAAIRWIEQGDRSELMPVLFAGTVLAFCLTMRGQLVLHASAVSWRGRALAFVGQSGRGKSTLAALAAAAGARVVTDDILLVDVDDHPVCRGSAWELRLRDGASGIADTFTAAERRSTADHRLGLLSADVEPGWVDLGAVVIPSPSREATALEVIEVSQRDAVIRLLAFPRVHGLRSPAVLRRQFELLGTMVRAIPVYEVVVPWGPPFGEHLAAELLTLADAARA